MLLSNIIRKKFDAVLGRYDASLMDFYFSPKDFPNIKVESFNVKSQYKATIKTAVNKEEISMKVDRPVTLKGYFYYYDHLDADKLVIFDHGIGSGHLAYFKEIEMLAQHGYTVYSYDHTGCVDSEGDGITGFAQGVHDLDEVISAIKHDPRFKDKTFKLVGHSWGGYSAMNVVVFQPQVTHVVSLAGFISTEALCSQYIPNLLQRYVKEVMADEYEKNPKYADLKGPCTIKNVPVKFMHLQSKDDTMVKYNMSMVPLEEALKDRPNTKLVTFENKNHAPHLTERAVALDNERTKEMEKLKKEGKLNTKEEQMAFRDKYDWEILCEQDQKVWEDIFDFLDN